MASPGLARTLIEAIVPALLAVNRYPLEKAWGLVPDLRKAGLLDPASVVDRDIGDLTVSLAAAGYDRGLLTEMFATRLRSLMAAIAAGQLDGLPDLVARRDESAACELLCTVKGIGPAVARNAWMLMK